MKYIWTIPLLILVAYQSNAQILKPVHWSYAAKKIDKHTALVFFKAQIDNGWHIYSTRQADGGPVKTSFNFLPSVDYTMIRAMAEPQPVTKFEKAFGIDVRYFEKSVIFQERVKLNSGHVVVKGKLKFMACNDHQCLPPEDVEYSISIP